MQVLVTCSELSTTYVPGVSVTPELSPSQDLSVSDMQADHQNSEFSASIAVSDQVRALQVSERRRCYRHILRLDQDKQDSNSFYLPFGKYSAEKIANFH